jgi:hypothetical protein
MGWRMQRIIMSTRSGCQVHRTCSFGWRVECQEGLKTCPTSNACDRLRELQGWNRRGSLPLTEYDQCEIKSLSSWSRMRSDRAKVKLGYAQSHETSRVPCCACSKQATTHLTASIDRALEGSSRCIPHLDGPVSAASKFDMCEQTRYRIVEKDDVATHALRMPRALSWCNNGGLLYALYFLFERSSSGSTDSASSSGNGSS